MRKIVSIVVFALAMIGSWHLIHSDPSIGFETHTGIQEKLIDLITNAVKSKRPNAQNFEMTKLWTETLSENKVRAVFAYRYTEPAMDEAGDETAQTIEGEAILHREPSTNQEIDRWVVQSASTSSDIVSFTEGSVVTPLGEEETTSVPAPPSESAQTPVVPAKASPDVKDTEKAAE